MGDPNASIPTPQPALPDPVYGVVADIVGQFGWEGRIGVTYPGVMKRGVVFTAANMDPSWIGTDMAAGLEAAIPGTVPTLPEMPDTPSSSTWVSM